MNTEPVAAYAKSLDSQRAAVCDKLQAVINTNLLQASSKLWHAIPVWFIGENPVVGYTARKSGVMLMFWNGQHFDEPELEASGSFHMAQIAYNDAAEIDEVKLAGWLQKAGVSIWDMVGERNAAVAAQRKAGKPKAKKAKKKPRTAVKAKKAARPRKTAKPAKARKMAKKRQKAAKAK